MRYSKILYCLICSVFLFTNINAQSIKNDIEKLGKNKQEARLSRLYDSLLRYNKDSNYVIGELRIIEAYANTQSLLSLKALNTSIIADHYARIRKYNTLSTNLHLQAIDIAIESQNKTRLGLCYYKLGRYCYSFNKFPVAFENFLKAQTIFYSLNTNSNEVVEFNFFMGSIYNDINNPQQAIIYFEKVAASTVNNKWFIINANNNIGLIYKHKKNYSKALQYFNATIDAAKKYGYPKWIDIATGNIGMMLYDAGNVAAAIPYIKASLTAQLKDKDFEYTIDALHNMVKYYLSTNKKDSALYYFNFIDTNANHRSKYKLLSVFYDTKSLISAYNKEYNDAYNFHITSVMAKDSFAKIVDAKSLKDIELKYETEQYLNNLRNVEVVNKNKIIIRNLLLIGVLFLLIFLAVLYTLEKKRAKVDKLLMLQQQQLLQTEERLAKQELEATQQQLNDIVDRLKEKNEIVKQYEEELNKLQPNKTITEVEKQNAFEELNEKTILTADDWDSFKTIFTKLHPHFFATLKQQYPQFTPSEVRVLALQKLNFSSADMAATLGISLDSVKKTKQRLRKKLPQNFEESPLEYFASTL